MDNTNNGNLKTVDDAEGAERALGPVAPRHGMSLQSVDPITLAGHFANSGFFKDTRQVSQAVVKIAFGQEHGIGPVSAMTNVHIIEGKPSMSAALIAALINRSRTYRYHVKTWTARVCEIEFYKGSQLLGTGSFTIEEASVAGLGGKDNWKKYPKAMLWARAMSQGATAYCPDVTMGQIYTPDELGADTDEVGNPINIIDITPSPAARDVPAPPEEKQPLSASETWAKFARKRLRVQLGCADPFIQDFIETVLDGMDKTGRDRNDPDDLQKLWNAIKEWETSSQAIQFLKELKVGLAARAVAADASLEGGVEDEEEDDEELTFTLPAPDTETEKEEAQAEDAAFRKATAAAAAKPKAKAASASK